MPALNFLWPWLTVETILVCLITEEAIIHNPVSDMMESKEFEKQLEVEI